MYSDEFRFAHYFWSRQTLTSILCRDDRGAGSHDVATDERLIWRLLIVLAMLPLRLRKPVLQVRFFD